MHLNNGIFVSTTKPEIWQLRHSKVALDLNEYLLIS